MAVPITIAIALLLAALIMLYDARQRPRYRFRRRSLLPEDATIALFADATGADPKKVLPLLQDLAEASELPIGRLRPTDRLFNDLVARTMFTDDHAFYLEFFIGKRLKEAGLAVNGACVDRLTTAADYVRLFSGAEP